MEDIFYRNELNAMSNQEIAQEYEKVSKRYGILDLRHKKLKETGLNLLFKLFSPKYRKLKKLQIKTYKILNKNITKLNGLCFEIDWGRDELVRMRKGVKYLSFQDNKI